MEINLTHDQVLAAVHAGLALTNPEDNRQTVPMKHAAGALVLRRVLTHILNGELMLTMAPSLAEEPPKEPPKEPTNIKSAKK